MSGSKAIFKFWTDFPIRNEILESLKENDLEKPMPIQIRSLKATLLDNKNVLGAARTGSGKTLAYSIPTINSILSNVSRPCSKLKRRICKIQNKKEDFELLEGEMVSIEDMIVDKLSNDGSDESETDDDTDLGSDELHPDSISEYSCPEAIILVPTRELASQVRNEIDKICKHTNIKTCCVIGGLSQDKQVRNLSKLKPQVVVATPGRLYDIVQSGNVKHLNIQSVASIRTLVVDEADRMMQKGHFEEMVRIIDIIRESKRFRNDDFPFRVYLYSATLTFLHELPDRFKKKFPLTSDAKVSKKKIKHPIDTKDHTKKNKIKQILNLLDIERMDTKIIDLNDNSSFGRPASEQLDELKIRCLAQEKDLYLYYFIIMNPNSRILVFCNSKDCLRRLSNILKYLGKKSLNLHADMDQKKRLSSLEKFRQHKDSVLIATDVAARGLDIKDLDCVVHYQVPKTCESYIHRSGRTARLDKCGTSLTLCEPKEVPFYRRLCNNINQGKDLDDYEVNLSLKKLLKQRVDLAQQCDKIDHQLRESRSNRNWFIKAAEECDIELEEEDLRHLGGKGKSQEQNLQEDALCRRRLKHLQKLLSNLLTKPLVTSINIDGTLQQ